MEELLARFSKREIIHAYITQQKELEGYEKERAILISKIEKLSKPKIRLTNKVEYMDFIISSFVKSICNDELIDLYDVAAKLETSINGIKKLISESN